MRVRTSTAGLAGFTIIEVAIVVMVLAVLARSMSLVSRTSEQAFEIGTAMTDVELRTGIAAAAIVAELERAAASSIEIDQSGNGGATEIAYRILDDFVAGAPVLSNRRVLRLELDPAEVLDGGDDDGDGLVDEGQIVLVEDEGGANESSRVLARGIRVRLQGELVNGADDNGNGLVDEAGLAITRVRDVIRVQATIAVALDHHPTGVMRTFERTVMLRN